MRGRKDRAGEYRSHQGRWQRVRAWWQRHQYIKYILVVAVFFVFTFLLGDASFFRQYKYRKRISRLEEELRVSYTKYKQDSIRLQEIRSSREGIEHIAREQFLMKAPDELIFVVADTSLAQTQTK